jgi:hypothetical protein
VRADGSNWPKRLDRDAVYIISMYKAGGVPLRVIAATYRAREQDVREFLKHHGVFAYLRPNSAKTYKRVYEEKKKAFVERVCLHCQRMFKSLGIGNRICSRCKDTDIFEGGGCAEDFPGGHL